jgi:hypothetical protein
MDADSKFSELSLVFRSNRSHRSPSRARAIVRVPALGHGREHESSVLLSEAPIHSPTQVHGCIDSWRY